MRLTTLINSDVTLEKLAIRLYPKLTDAERIAAAAELLRANPHLSDRSLMQSGLIVKIPSLTGQRININGVPDDPVDDLRVFWKRMLSGYKVQLTQQFEATLASTDWQIQQLARDDVAEAIKTAKPEDSELAVNLAHELKSRRSAVRTEQTNRLKILDQIAKDLDLLLD